MLRMMRNTVCMYSGIVCPVDGLVGSWAGDSCGTYIEVVAAHECEHPIGGEIPFRQEQRFDADLCQGRVSASSAVDIAWS
jgi:hypothetical protein